MAKVTVKQSSINGVGVFSLRSISKGEMILAIDDSRLVTAEFPLDESRGELEYHCDYLAGGKVVLMQFPERHINHSCDPNTFVKTILGTRWDCNCGSTQCRRTIHSDFFHLPFDLQIEYLPLLDGWYIEEYKGKVQALLESH